MWSLCKNTYGMHEKMCTSCKPLPTYTCTLHAYYTGQNITQYLMWCLLLYPCSGLFSCFDWQQLYTCMLTILIIRSLSQATGHVDITYTYTCDLIMDTMFIPSSLDLHQTLTTMTSSMKILRATSKVSGQDLCGASFGIQALSPSGASLRISMLLG